MAAIRCLLRILTLALVFGLIASGTALATEGNLEVLYDFCQQSSCADGQNPTGLIMDAAGNLYGTTELGGYQNAGTVFKLTPGAAGWTETVLYSFCSQTNCSDGGYPATGVIIDAAGNLYGITNSGGNAYPNIGGTVFKLAPGAAGWAETVLYRFCSRANCSDGQASSDNELMLDGAGNLYGTIGQGGTYEKGVVFKLAPNGSGWTETVLYSFCAVASCADGADPSGQLIMDTAGNLYGTATYGGSSGYGGVVFELTPGSTGWTETVLYSFCSQSNCSDGEYPTAGVIIDAAGTLYGTTAKGGSNSYGVVFELTPGNAGWSEAVLYNFSKGPGGSPLITDSAGNLYGTTGPPNNEASGGTIFKLTRDNTVWTETDLTAFGSTCIYNIGCLGAGPSGHLVLDSFANLYGTTRYGGSCGGFGCGLAFKQDVAGYYLTLTVSAGGTVLSSVRTLGCSSTTCSWILTAGDQITLTADPSVPWAAWAGWSGACGGIARTCALTMDSAKSVSAIFSPLFTVGAPPVVTNPGDNPALPPPIIGPLPQ
jgi:uncharacterized repeat protein (TIGR03803 family)